MVERSRQRNAGGRGAFGSASSAMYPLGGPMLCGCSRYRFAMSAKALMPLPSRWRGRGSRPDLSDRAARTPPRHKPATHHPSPCRPRTGLRRYRPAAPRSGASAAQHRLSYGRRPVVRQAAESRPGEAYTRPLGQIGAGERREALPAIRRVQRQAIQHPRHALVRRVDHSCEGRVIAAPPPHVRRSGRRRAIQGQHRQTDRPFLGIGRRPSPRERV